MAEESLPGWMRELNEQQVQLLQFVQRQGRITRREYEKLADVGSTVAKQDLRALIERGLLARRGAGPGTYYVATESGRPLGNSATDKRPITTDSA
jgi:predicted HTH transcriptional regulator